MTAPGSTALFETLTLKMFVRRRMYDDPQRLLELLDELQNTVLFGGFAHFDYVGWFPIAGPFKKRRLDPGALHTIRTMIRNGSMRAFGMGVEQSVHHFRFSEIALNFDAFMPPDDDGMNKLQMYIAKDKLVGKSCAVVRDLFLRCVTMMEPNYGFSAVHVDAPDSRSAEQEFRRRLPQQPVDFLNDTRYVWDSDRVIRDIGWLNYLSQAHLEQLSPVAVTTLRSQPFYREMAGGVFFGIGDDPFSDYRGVLPTLRQALAPIICEPR